MDSNKERIIVSAIDLFIARGCKNTTMDQVAGAVHISKRTLYETFTDKEALLDNCLQEILNRIGNKHREFHQITEHPLLLTLLVAQHHAQIMSKYERLIEDASNYYPELFKKRFSISYDKLVELVISLLNNANEKGFLRPNANLTVAAHAMVFMTEQIRKHPAFANNQRHIIISEFIFNYMRGLLSEQTIIEYSKEEQHFKQIIENQHDSN